MRSTSLLFLAALVFAVAPTDAAAIVAPVSSSFDSDADGWTGDNPGEFFWDPSGGNPDGFLHFDDAAPSGGIAIAPAKFLGNWSALDGVGQIRYDHRVIDAGAHTASHERVIFLSGPGGSAQWLGPFVCPGQGCSTSWETFTAPLDESEWNVTSGSWAALLADVTDLRIQGDHYTSISLPTANEAHHLQVPRSQPVLVTEAVNVDPTGRPIEYGVARVAAARANIVIDKDMFVDTAAPR